jgi:hypothetical protein
VSRHGAPSPAAFDRLEEKIAQTAGVVLGLRERNQRLQELLHEADQRRLALEDELAARPERDLAPELDAERARRAGFAGQLNGWIERLAALEA